MLNNIQKFSARWSVFVWCMTIIIGLVVFVMIPYGILSAIWTGKLTTDVAKDYSFLIGVIGVPVVFVLAVFFAPLKYTITNSEIITNRLGPNVVVPIKSIHDINRIPRKELGPIPLRVFGVGGFCGSYGYFWSLRLGLFKAYITNTQTLIFIKYGDNKKILLSPERPEEFLRAITQAKNRLSSAQ
jgi:hypothetical protein